MKRRNHAYLAALMALILALLQPVAVFADETVPSVSEEGAVTGEEETAAEEVTGSSDDEDVVYDRALTSREQEIKENVVLHDVPGAAAKAEAGKDYIDNEVMCLAESREHAMAIAEAYGASLKSYEYGVAVLDLTDSGLSVCDAVAIGASPDNNIPAVEPDYITTIVEPEEEDISNPALYAGSPTTKTAWEAVYSPVSEGGLGFDDPALNPENPDYQWMHDMANTYDAWGITTGSSDVTVAVIDTGVLANHEELKGRVTAHEVNNDAGVGLGTADVVGHGTHVAGIIAAAAGNHKGGAGIAPGVKILSICIQDTKTNDMPSVALIRALYYAAGYNDIAHDEFVKGERRADIINMSLGFPMYEALQEQAVDAAYENGVTMIASMGNDWGNFKQYPAAYDHVIAVSALDESGVRANYSSFGSWADISAPGSNIYSSVNTADSAYEKMSGTSMATPVVAGACALYMSALGHHVDPDEMEQALKGNVDRISGKGMGAGMVDIGKLLKSTGRESRFEDDDPSEGSDRQESGENTASEKAVKVAIDTGAGYDSHPEYKVKRTKKGLLSSVQLFTVDVDDEAGLDEKTIMLKPVISTKAGDDISNAVQVRWSSSNKNVAEVIPSGSGNGVNVRAKGRGTANITCMALDGSKKKATIKVNVIVPVSHLTLTGSGKNGYSSFAAFGKTISVKAVTGDTYGTPSNKKVTWDYDFVTIQIEEDGGINTTGVADDNDYLKKKKLVSVKNGKVKMGSEKKWKNAIGYGYMTVYGVNIKAVTTDGTGETAEYLIMPAYTTTSMGIYVDYLYGYVRKTSKGIVYLTDGNQVFRLLVSRKGYGNVRYTPYTMPTVVSSNPGVATAMYDYDAGGLVVTPGAKGTTKLTFYATDGTGVKGTFKVTVR